MSWFSSLRKSKPEAVPELTDVLVQGDAPKAKSRARSKAKEDQSDPALPEKKRARRRLVGAIVMTLTLVIVLPMLLDAEPQPVSREINIQVHAKHKPNKTEPDKLATAALPPPAPTSSDSAADSEKASGKTPEKKPAATATPVKTVVKTSPKTTAKVPSKAPAQSSKVTAPAHPSKNAFMIQVAALSSMESVKELRVRLAIAGFKSQIQKVATQNGERIRIRVGPYESRKAAEKACPKLSTMKLRCLLVTSG